MILCSRRSRLSVVVDMFDFGFAENGLTAYRKGVQLPSQVTHFFSLLTKHQDHPFFPCVELHRVHGRGEVQNLCQLCPEVPRGPRHPQEEGNLHRVQERNGQHLPHWKELQVGNPPFPSPMSVKMDLTPFFFLICLSVSVTQRGTSLRSMIW